MYSEKAKNIIIYSNHLQLYYIPVVDSWKEKVYQKDENGKVLKNKNGSPIQARNDKGKLIYNDVINSDERRINRTQFWQNKGGKTSYTQMQDRFYEQISKEYGLGRGEKGSTREHTTKQEWEQQKLDREIVAKHKELTSHQQNIKKIKDELDYAKDGFILLPQLATKTKTTEIQDQNIALRLEVKNLQSENTSLKAENDKLKAQEQARIDALKDRSSIARISLDALDQQRIYKVYTKTAKDNFNGLDAVMKPYESMVEKAHGYGEKMVAHKQNYVICLESRKSAQNDIQKAQEKKHLGQIRAIESQLNTSRFQLERLEQDRSAYSPIQVLKKRECDKQIRKYSDKIKSLEEILENKFDMKYRMDRIAVSDEIRWYEGEIKICKQEINEKSILADNLTDKAQKHLKEYKSMQLYKTGFHKPIQNIIDRYDKEYIPPQEHNVALELYNRQGLPCLKAEEREYRKQTFDQWKELVNQNQAEQQLINSQQEKVQPKIQVHSRSR